MVATGGLEPPTPALLMRCLLGIMRFKVSIYSVISGGWYDNLHCICSAYAVHMQCRIL